MATSRDSKAEMKRTYYVYAYLRASNNVPYYIGKGTGKRAWAKNHGSVSVPKDKTKIVILHENLLEQEAHNLEISLIAEYGRKDLNTGVLLNQTDGGDGASGRVLSDESIKKISESVRKANASGQCGFTLGHASLAGKRGGTSKSEKKANAARDNQKKSLEKIKGSKWMYDPVNNVNRRIPVDQIETLLNKGWEVKFRQAHNKGVTKSL